MASFTLHETLLHLPSMHCEKAAVTLTCSSLLTLRWTLFFSLNTREGLRGNGFRLSCLFEVMMPFQIPLKLLSCFEGIISAQLFLFLSSFNFMSISARIITTHTYTYTWMMRSHFIVLKLKQNSYKNLIKMSLITLFIKTNCVIVNLRMFSIRLDRQSVCLFICWFSLSLSPFSFLLSFYFSLSFKIFSI